jgi:hypothetical protein
LCEGRDVRVPDRRSPPLVETSHPNQHLAIAPNGYERRDAVASLLLIRFPDDSWEYHVPIKQLAVGDVIRSRGYDWTVSDVEQTGDKLVVAVSREPVGGDDWPGPLDEIEVLAPAA